MVIVSIEQFFIYFKAKDTIAKELNATYVKSKRCYRIPLNLYSLRELYKVCEGDNKTLIADLGLQFKKKYDEMLIIKSLDCGGFDARLRPYQNQDVNYLSKLPHKAIFNEQRTGKTPTTLITLKESGAKRILIVCPSSLKGNWSSEFGFWLDRPSTIIEGPAKKRVKLLETFNEYDNTVGIISYETLRNDFSKVTSKFDAMIVDEAHRLRNYKTQQSKAILKMGQQATTRYALTGTPSVNHAVDVYGILKFLYPAQYPSYWQFAERYFDMEASFYSEMPDIGTLKSNRIKEWLGELNLISIQRKRKDVMTWLPDIQEQVIELDAEPQQRKEYEQMLATYAVGEVDAQNDLVRLIRLRQIALAPELLGLKGASPKIKFILEYIEDNPDTPIIIFSAFTSFLNLLAKKLSCDYGLVTGETRFPTHTVDSFQNGRFNILLSNIKVGGVGHTMDRGEVTIFTDRSFSPMENDQAQDRFVPTTEGKAKDSKLIIDLVLKDSVDARVFQILKDKKDITSFVNDYGLKILLGERLDESI
jgi:SNF2 family DNA or RNA helicase